MFVSQNVAEDEYDSKIGWYVGDSVFQALLPDGAQRHCLIYVVGCGLMARVPGIGIVAHFQNCDNGTEKQRLRDCAWLESVDLTNTVQKCISH